MTRVEAFALSPPHTWTRGSTCQTLLCRSMAASQAQRTVNIYPGLPRTGLINEKKGPSQHIVFPEESLRPSF